MKYTHSKFRNPCLKCGREEKDAFLGSCFSCWRDMSSRERRELKEKSRGSPPGPLPAHAAAPV